jgi:hypothetical protein
MEKYCGAGQATDDNMAHAHHYTRLQKHIHNKYLVINVKNSYCIISTAFPLQQWLRECSSMLRYTYIAGLIVLGLAVSGKILDVQPPTLRSAETLHF